MLSKITLFSKQAEFCCGIFVARSGEETFIAAVNRLNGAEVRCGPS